MVHGVASSSQSSAAAQALLSPSFLSSATWSMRRTYTQPVFTTIRDPLHLALAGVVVNGQDNGACARSR
jgi:hypothetical protein